MHATACVWRAETTNGSWYPSPKWLMGTVTQLVKHVSCCFYLPASQPASPLLAWYRFCFLCRVLSLHTAWYTDNVVFCRGVKCQLFRDGTVVNLRFLVSTGPLGGLGSALTLSHFARRESNVLESLGIPAVWYSIVERLAQLAERISRTTQKLEPRALNS